jgi:hypothetical protein
MVTEGSTYTIKGDKGLVHMIIKNVFYSSNPDMSSYVKFIIYKSKSLELKENFCENNIVKSEPIYCPDYSATQCLDGACV